VRAVAASQEFRLTRAWFCTRSAAIFLALAALNDAGCSAYDSGLLPSRSSAITSDSGLGGGAGATALDAGRDAAPAADSGKATECNVNPEFPTCVRPHAETTCASSVCFVVKCIAPYADCDHDPDDGCEARLDSADDCGLCGAACDLAHAEAACVSGRCVMAHCEHGFGNCDDDPGNGCETKLDDIESCGACGTKCKATAHALPGCIDGKCGVGACIGAFGDCNGDPKDGCEQALDSDSSCKACGMACDPAQASGTCASGDCVISSCQGSHVDCNGLVGDGCEATLDSAAHCGSCSNKCALPNALRQKCDTQTTPACMVDHDCQPGELGCQNGRPENGCSAGFGDCDHDPSNGCETDLSRLKDCGSCGNSCVLANTVTACVNGECELVGCVPGYDRCSLGAPCSSLAGDPQHCGSCSKVCNSGGKTNCAGGICTDQVCGAGTADCDGSAANGCEASLSSAGNCGVCGNSCGPFAHATAACNSGACGIGSCDVGYADCDGDASDGCEVNTHTLTDCGACGKTCAFANAQASCANGTCNLTSCNSGRADCDNDPSNGCETDLKLPADCGACGNDCSAGAHVLSSGCSQGKCQLVCESGRADCDKNAANGCEADLSSTASCGACGNDCKSLPHVSSASCGSSSCKNLVCASGWADCNGDPSDGCERSIRTNSDCGACNQACAPAHGAGTCATGSCVITSCDSGFDNCNNAAADGCEASLSSPGTCGSCGKKCNAGFVCNNGQCACTKDADCGGGTQSCCGGACTDTGGACFPWPCIPGTARSNNANCGGCGTACALFCCSTP
jgi:hypothetical protein